MNDAMHQAALDIALDERSKYLRKMAIKTLESGKRAHLGSAMSIMEIIRVIYDDYLQYDVNNLKDPNRDRFILSAGHGCMLLYSLLHLTGFKDMPIEELKNFRQLGSKTAGHPEYGHALGVETTTGPLVQGISNAVGMAIAEKLLNNKFGDEIVKHNTYVIASDGDLMEGISQEAISLAGHLGLSKLIVLFDDNNISID